MCKNFFSFFSSFSFSIFSSFCPVTPGHPCNHGDPPPLSPWLLMLLLLLLLLLFLFLLLLLINDSDSISRTFLEQFVLVFSSHWLTRAPPKSLWKSFVKLDRGFCADASLSHFNQQWWCSLRRQSANWFDHSSQSWQLLTLSLISCHRNALLLIKLSLSSEIKTKNSETFDHYQ